MEFLIPAVLNGSYTPTWEDSISNPSIGNGTLTGFWQLAGKLLTCSIRIKAGSTTNFGGGGAYFFYVPSQFTIDSSKYASDRTIVGTGYYNDASSSPLVYYIHYQTSNGNSKVGMAQANLNGFNASNPTVKAVNDSWHVDFTVWVL